MNEMTDMEMAERVAECVAICGGETYFVGGYVRDLLRGCPGKDIDIEVHGIEPRKLKLILEELGTRMEIGASFGIYGLKGYNLDIAMPRREKNTGEGHRDFEICVDPYCGTKNAALRRDFTINAMMQNVLTGEIVDHFGGRKDLEEGIIRHVNDESFGEDPLRVLRGAQFAARFGFRIAEETKEICSRMNLSALACERILGEMEKALLKAEKPSVFFEELRRMNQLSAWFPEVEALTGVEQNPKHHPEGDVWVHTMMVVDAAAKLRKYVSYKLGFMLSALAHDFGKAVCTERVNGVIRSYNHETLGLPLAEKFIKRLTNQKYTAEYVMNMMEYHMKPNMLAADNSSVKATNKMFDASCDPEALICLAVADGMGKSADGEYVPKSEWFSERLKIYEEYMARPFVAGRDLIEAGLKPDERFSEYLDFAHKLRLAGVSKEVAIKQVLALAEKRGC